jgi:oxygen-independent coproporphyrinogen III oxidase
MSDSDTGLGELLCGRLPSHFYVHVPFCASKCGYCDFASVSDAPENIVRAVFTGIRTQLTRWSLTGLPGVVETVYFGGGTPTCHPGEVLRLLGHVREHFTVHLDAEITVEANPDSLTQEMVRDFGAAGVTRISVGVQSLDDRVLRILGRRHDAQSAMRACRAVIDAGVELSVDLICGVPGQSMTSWSETLERAVSTGARHMSVYPLTIEDDTPLQVAISAGLLDEPDPDMAAEMMILAEAMLGYHGLGRYEVANYAETRANESRHNTAYWTGRPYIGVGPGAHGMLDPEVARVIGLISAQDADVTRVRYANAASIDDWLVGAGDSHELLSAGDTAREDVMLGLRLVRGVAAELVSAAGLVDVLKALAEDGLVELVDGRWRTTQRGWLLGNVVFGRVWAGE